MAQKKRLADKTDKRARGRVRIGTDSDGKPIYRWVSAPTRKELEARLEELRAHANGETGIDPERVTLEEYAQTWLDLQAARLKPSTVARYASVLRTRVLPTLGARRLCKVLPSDLQRVVGGARGTTKESAAALLTVLHGLFRAAAADGLLDRDPSAHLVVTGTVASHPRRALTPEEDAALVAVIHGDGEMRRALFVALLYYCGLRASEALGLRWEDVDTRARVLHVRRSVDATTGQPTMPKTAAGVRDVPMPSPLVEYLRGKVGIGWVFAGPHGDPMRYSSCVARWWKATLADMRAIYPGTGADLTPHSLRHSYASRLYASGISVVQAQAWLGHESVSTTLGVYTHISSSDKSRNLEMLDESFALLPNGCQAKK